MKTARSLIGVFLWILGTGMQAATPHASFTAGQTTGCAPFTVSFTNTSTNWTACQWRISNGSASTLTNPSITFTAPGSYDVTLVVTDGNRGDSITLMNYITVVDYPHADFSAANTAACPDLSPITFFNSSTAATSYTWDFGDGTTSGNPTPVHTYHQSGDFTITLIAANQYGCQDVYTRNQYITIFAKPDATVTVDTALSCDPANMFQFSNNSPNTISWNWSFGDGSFSAAAAPVHQYGTYGTFPVRLILENTRGCRDTSDQDLPIVIGQGHTVEITVSEDTGCAPLNVHFHNPNSNIVSSNWNFGDGTGSSQYTTDHTFTLPGIYPVSLLMVGMNGCPMSIGSSIVVVEKPSVGFTVSSTAGCAPVVVNFSNQSLNFDSCRWLFGDGSSSFLTNPTHLYNYSGDYDVTLECWNSSGCANSVTQHQLVHVTATTASFTSDHRMGCPPLDVDFTAMSQGSNLNYSWDFGDGSTSSIANPHHTYTTNGAFDVRLIVSDPVGCTDTLSRSAYIQTINPVAGYTPPPTTVGCAPLTTQFTDATFGAVTWLWNFGDGQTSTEQNPSHTYTIPGFYTVSLTTTSAGGGCVQTISNFSTFDVRGGYAGFNHTATACPPYEAQFIDTSLNAVAWLWNFGDGTTSTDPQPSHTYEVGGYHSVSLNITTADGCSYSTMQSNGVYFTPFGANFYTTTLDSVIPRRVLFHANSLGATGWQWDFGDSTGSNLENPMHTYTTANPGPVSLTITNGRCTLTYSATIINFGDPDSSVIDPGNPGLPVVQRGCAPLQVSFTQDYHVAGALAYRWNFGDGSGSTEEFPIHLYKEAGIYSVYLEITDSMNRPVQIFLDSIVRVSGPQAGFRAIQSTNCQQGVVTFVDTSKNAARYLWNFGDGNTSTLAEPVHAFNGLLSNYIISQTVIDTNGCSSTISTSIFSNTNEPLLVTETDVCGADTVQFFTSMRNYAGYVWYFGDGDSSLLANPSHVFSREGTFHPSLTTYDATGCGQTYQAPAITVNLPQAAFSTTDARRGCDQLTVQLDNTSANADLYAWDFGDGHTSTAMHPSHTYSGAGSYTVTLTAYRANCISRQTEPQWIRVDTAHAAFNAGVTTICLPMSVQFRDLSTNAVSWNWIFNDGDSASTQHPLHLFTNYVYRPITLAITDVNGCRDTATRAPIAPLITNFTADDRKGCIPHTVNFRNGTTVPYRCLWDFGDGTSSTAMNPQHTYAGAGVYDVTLITWSDPYYGGGCTDTLVMHSYIQALQPAADFSTADLYACAPSLVHFNNLSSFADRFVWDFGDSTTSTNDTASHIYERPGTYTVKLVATSGSGCADSIVKQQYIHVMGPQTDFTASAFEGCAPFAVNFTDLSINASSWSWTFGDGSAGTLQHPNHVFTDTGSFSVALVTRDTSGCSSFDELPRKIIVHPSPEASFTVPAYSGCQPFTTFPINTSSGYTSLRWDFGDGTGSGLSQPGHTYTNAGQYDLMLIAVNDFGCSDTAFSLVPLEALAVPQAGFSVTDRNGCPPLQTRFIDASTNTQQASYQWDFGNGTYANVQNPNAVFNTPGVFDVTLHVTNANGCSADTVFHTCIMTFDTVPPNESRINSVSVTSNTTVEITWDVNPSIDLAAYVLYRQNAFTRLYEVIHTEQNISNTGFQLNTSYTDTGLNTLENTYTYKLQAIDRCGYTIPIDQLTPHTTVNVTAAANDSSISITWTPYMGCPVASYEIYRCEEGQPMTYLGTVNGNTLWFIDSTFGCPHTWSYRIMATDLCGSGLTSWSDTSTATPPDYFAEQVVKTVRSTVVDNRFVLTEWLQPEIHPEKVVQFDLYRSTDNVNFEYIASVPPQMTSFEDLDVSVQTTNYYYRIQTINACNILESPSSSTSTIVLDGDMDENEHVHLQWTPYEGWEQGVEYYVIEKQDEHGNWIRIRQVDGTSTNFDFEDR